MNLLSIFTLLHYTSQACNGDLANFLNCPGQKHESKDSAEFKDDSSESRDDSADSESFMVRYITVHG